MMKIKMSKTVINESAERHVFITPMSAQQKSLYNYFFLKLSIIVSFQNFEYFLLVKQLSKAFTKFHCEKVIDMSAWCILVNGGPTQVLKYFFSKLLQIFNMLLTD